MEQSTQCESVPQELAETEALRARLRDSEAEVKRLTRRLGLYEGALSKLTAFSNYILAGPALTVRPRNRPFDAGVATKTARARWTSSRS